MTRDDVLRYLLETGEGSYARGMLKLAEFIGLHPGHLDGVDEVERLRRENATLAHLAQSLRDALDSATAEAADAEYAAWKNG